MKVQVTVIVIVIVLLVFYFLISILVFESDLRYDTTSESVEFVLGPLILGARNDNGKLNHSFDCTYLLDKPPP